MNDGKSSDDQIHKKGTIPSSASEYLNPRYWDERFSEEEHYEWFKDYSHFRHLVLQRVEPRCSVLELGCGNSQLCDDMFEDGIDNITCIDLSATAVERMRKRLSGKGYKGIKVLEADMLDLPFPDEQYDVVIEKGTMDVLFVDSGDPWNPHPTTVSKVMQMLREVHRVLKIDGIFISITFGQPHFRRPLFDSQEFSWSVEWSTFGDGFHYFFYTLKKGHRSLAGDVPKERLEVPSISLLHEELEGWHPRQTIACPMVEACTRKMYRRVYLSEILEVQMFVANAQVSGTEVLLFAVFICSTSLGIILYICSWS